ncbi:MAG: DHH family phosphoesterase [Candidatus Aminicenantes bacterium]|nr:DHH family phosphoesterase [Candidatus Aminicenantes bacterium]
MVSFYPVSVTEMNFNEKAKELVEKIKAYKHILICIKGSPDPDAVAAAFVLKVICEKHGIKATIDSPDPPSLPQNVKLIKDLHLPIHFKPLEEDVKKCDAYAVVDHQSVFVEGVTGAIPCAVHIDHHKPTAENIPVDFKIVMEDTGSASTIVTFLIKELGVQFEKKLWKRAATALYYGIQTDTDNFQQSYPLDMEALTFVTPYTDKVLLKTINHLPFPKETMEFLNLALQNQVIYKEWLISGVGFIDEKFRDNIAIIGDFLLKREDIFAVAIFCIVKKAKGLTLDASFRTSDDHLNLNRLIKELSKDGGARRYKGAFQVNLDYFFHTPDKEQLWEMVRETTVEALKKKIDEVAWGGIGQFFNRFKNKISSWFR